MSSDLGIGAGASAPWYRVVAIPDVSYGGSAERDYAAVLPALLDAVQNRRTFVTGWLSRGGGAPLELLTNAGPLPSPATGAVADATGQAERSGGRHQDDGYPYGPPGTSPSKQA